MAARERELKEATDIGVPNVALEETCPFCRFAHVDQCQCCKTGQILPADPAGCCGNWVGKDRSPGNCGVFDGSSQASAHLQ